MTRIKDISIAIIVLISLYAPFALAQTSPANPVIRIGNLNLGPYLPVAYIAKVAAKYGVQVKISEFRRSLEIASAVKANDLDVGVGGIDGAVVAVATGAPVVVVSNVSDKGVGWVGRSDIKWNSLRDLKGKKFATIHGLHELIADTIFEENGLTVSDQPGAADVQLLFVPSSPQLVTALKIHEVDATGAPEPFPSRAIADGYAVPILTPAQVYSTKLGAFPRGIYMRRDFIEKYPETAQGFVNALVDATKTFRDHPDIAKDFALNGELKGAIDESDWDLASKNQDWDVSLTEANVQAFADQMLKFHMIEQPLKAADFTDLSMLQKAEKQLGW
jgi:NitT/TauT family transport system substrate-binding protein